MYGNPAIHGKSHSQHFLRQYLIEWGCNTYCFQGDGIVKRRGPRINHGRSLFFFVCELFLSNVECFAVVFGASSFFGASWKYLENAEGLSLWSVWYVMFWRCFHLV